MATTTIDVRPPIVKAHNGRGRALAKANARLIVAAPDLYAAYEQVSGLSVDLDALAANFHTVAAQAGQAETFGHDALTRKGRVAV